MYVYVKKLVEGESIPGIIRNGGYHLSHFGIYEDGTISCWHRNDLAQFRHSLETRWVVTEIPVGEPLSVFQLGYYEVTAAEWHYTPQTYYEHIISIIRRLNPEWENIYTETPRITEKWKRAHIGFSDTPVDSKVNTEFGYRLTDGASTFVFHNSKKRTDLTFLAVYKDKTFHLETIPDKDLSFADIEKMFADGTLSTSPAADIWINIAHIGKVRLKTVNNVPVKEKLRELEERMLRLADEPTAHDKCIAAYHEYLEYPCDETLGRLRQAYENVPGHERCYLGDMDTRDTDYQRILYSDRKREV